MDKSLAIGAALGIGLVSASGVVAGYRLLKGEDPPAIVRSAPLQGVPVRDAFPPAAAEACGPGALAGREVQERFQESRAEQGEC